MPCEHVPPRLGDPDPRDLDRLAASNHALGRRGREPGVDQRGHVVDREAVRYHHGLGAAIAGCGEQFESAAAVGFGKMFAAGHRIKSIPRYSGMGRRGRLYALRPPQRLPLRAKSSGQAHGRPVVANRPPLHGPLSLQ
jgi:hypothetical protein